MQDPKPVPEAVKQGVESTGRDIGALPGECQLRQPVASVLAMLRCRQCEKQFSSSGELFIAAEES